MTVPALPRVAAAAALLGALLPPLTAAAADIDSIGNLTQSQFKLLSEDLGAALSFKPLIPSEPLGVPGFDIGLAVTGTDLKNPLLLSIASSGQSVDTLMAVPSLRGHVGLPFNIDIGASYSQVPDTNIELWGGELRWAIMEGSTALPAVALRASYTATTGIDQLKLSTAGADISISKGIAMFTPYAGIGQVWVKSTPQGVPTLNEESFTQTKYYAGVNVFLGINFAFEIDSTGDIVTYGAKVGVRF
jgi:hypothetical protein